MKALIGTGVAMVTPFNLDDTVDTESLTRLTHFLINGRVDYLVVLGSTGEAATQSEEDMDLVIRTVMAANEGKLPIVLGVGGNDTMVVCKRMQEWTEKYDPAAFLSVSPMYNKPSQDGIFHHFTMVSRSTTKPIILYNVPGRTGSNMEATTTLALARRFSNIIGIKEASGNIEQCMAIVAGAPEGFIAISGDDAIALPLIACGFQGVISVVANVVPRPFTDVIRLSLAGNFPEARAVLYKLLPFIQICFAEGNPVSVKIAMNLLGLCQKYVRLPLMPGSDALERRMQKMLAEMGS